MTCLILHGERCERIQTNVTHRMYSQLEQNTSVIGGLSTAN
jgi:hypothetical protein